MMELYLADEVLYRYYKQEEINKRMGNGVNPVLIDINLKICIDLLNEKQEELQTKRLELVPAQEKRLGFDRRTKLETYTGSMKEIDDSIEEIKEAVACFTERAQSYKKR